MLDDTALRLYQAVAAACPIEGVAIGDPADKATWRIDFAPRASAAQREAAAAVLAAFVALTAAGDAASAAG
ncbi:MAG: hypothetical protein JO267_06985 [Alphaproteobacteria bacterium]|nr:hypothetical protein [Alphaproteobacteria bacterium]